MNTERALIAYKGSKDESSEDSVSDVNLGSREEESKETEKHADIKDMVAKMEIIDDTEKYDDPFQSVF
jgi:hypothetical protein